MRRLLISSVLAVATAVTGLPLTATTASAQDVELRIDRDGPQLRLREGCNPNYEDCYDRGRYDRRDYDRRGYYEAEHRGCTPDRALRKAERMGIRRARIVDVDRRSIEVRGRDRRGDRVYLTFGRRDRSCPVW